ncbi:MAG: hypothetical protein HOE90_09020 [Bacteriovoracaceae bacterium]|jgi:hypothetical protein|nr:hypothetical protein [Bacteriovoracaceae bacterium]
MQNIRYGLILIILVLTFPLNSSGESTGTIASEQVPEKPFQVSISFNRQHKSIIVFEDELTFWENDGIILLKVKECNKRMVKGLVNSIKYVLNTSLIYHNPQKHLREVYFHYKGENKIAPYNSRIGNYLRRLSEHVTKIFSNSKVSCIVPKEMEIFHPMYSRIQFWVERKDKHKVGRPYHWYEFPKHHREVYIPFWYDPEY